MVPEKREKRRIKQGGLCLSIGGIFLLSAIAPVFNNIQDIQKLENILSSAENKLMISGLFFFLGGVLFFSSFYANSDEITDIKIKEDTFND